MKFVILGILVFFAYRMFIQKPLLDKGANKEPLQEPDQDGFADYEEVE